ncbi:PRA1 family protein 2-like [Penaeus chinensis]|uniref:PRA1 family protein 2-like n=1 Tax=Penaeus chinensis TaxID=139456 RepID=UPI001FB5AB6A|nr:PRA1 family protein 2-like [Penaeus chinensis]
MAEQENTSVSPLRSLDDFLMESARFQIPNFKDGDKWANRVIQNLLYYQTNYFLTYFVIFAVVGSPLLRATHSRDKVPKPGNRPTEIALIATTPYKVTEIIQMSDVILSDCDMMTLLTASLLEQVIIVIDQHLAVEAEPLGIIFIHASMRLRNLKNKLMNKIEYIGLKRTPMGVILDALGLEQEFMM